MYSASDSCITTEFDADVVENLYQVAPDDVDPYLVIAAPADALVGFWKLPTAP